MLSRARAHTCGRALFRLQEIKIPTGLRPGALAVAVTAFAAAASRGHRPQRRRCARAAAAAAPEQRQLCVLVPVADDSEEIETACITDTLVRAGAKVTVASVAPEGRLQVRMSRGLKVIADVAIAECVGKQWDAIACPGGMPGAERLRDCPELTSLLKEQRASGRLTAAVCAAPAVVLASHGILGDEGRTTSYPADAFKASVGDGWVDAKAVVDGCVVTSQGPGTSLQFALKIVEQLYGRGKAEELAAQMVTEAV